MSFATNAATCSFYLWSVTIVPCLWPVFAPCRLAQAITPARSFVELGSAVVLVAYAIQISSVRTSCTYIEDKEVIIELL